MKKLLIISFIIFLAGCNPGEKEKGESKTILFNLCGHGHFDMTAYQDYFDNKLADDVFEEENVNKALANLPNVE